MQLITLILFDDLYGAVLPAPHAFIGGLWTGIWVLWLFRLRQFEVLVLQIGAGRPPGSGSELHFKLCEGGGREGSD